MFFVKVSKNYYSPQEFVSTSVVHVKMNFSKTLKNLLNILYSYSLDFYARTFIFLVENDTALKKLIFLGINYK